VGAEMRRNNRGLYFPEKKYVAEVLPDWSERHKLNMQDNGIRPTRYCLLKGL
jgi:hypothetical protein